MNCYSKQCHLKKIKFHFKKFKNHFSPDTVFVHAVSVIALVSISLINILYSFVINMILTSSSQTVSSWNSEKDLATWTTWGHEGIFKRACFSPMHFWVTNDTSCNFPFFIFRGNLSPIVFRSTRKTDSSYLLFESSNWFVTSFKVFVLSLKFSSE